MKAIVDVEIAPADQTWVTPLELMEDFADAVPTWFYLEEESIFYAAEKQVPACVLRTIDPEGRDYIDLAFAALEPSLRSPLHLCVIAPADPQQILSLEVRNQVIRRFLSAFRRYLRARTDLVELHPVEAEVAGV